MVVPGGRGMTAHVICVLKSLAKNGLSDPRSRIGHGSVTGGNGIGARFTLNYKAVGFLIRNEHLTLNGPGNDPGTPRGDAPDRIEALLRPPRC